MQSRDFRRVNEYTVSGIRRPVQIQSASTGKETTTMNISVNQEKVGTWKRSSFSPILTVLIAAFAFAVVAGVLAWQGTGNSETIARDAASAPAAVPMPRAVTPTYYYLVNSEADGAAILAATNEVDSPYNAYFLDMSNPENERLLELMSEDLLIAAMAGNEVNTFIVDARK